LWGGAGAGENGLQASALRRAGGDHCAVPVLRRCEQPRTLRQLRGARGEVAPVADGTVPGNCKGKVVSCAARSTCGKPGFVRCLLPTDTCVVDPATGLGICAKNPALACVTDLDCGAKCKTKSSADRCTQGGGIVGGSGSCCAACASPSGAFLN
jgi:hypothetical protein